MSSSRPQLSCKDRTGRMCRQSKVIYQDQFRELPHSTHLSSAGAAGKAPRRCDSSRWRQCDAGHVADPRGCGTTGRHGQGGWHGERGGVHQELRQSLRPQLRHRQHALSGESKDLFRIISTCSVALNIYHNLASYISSSAGQGMDVPVGSKYI